MSSPLYTRPCCNIKTCSQWQVNVTVSVSRSTAMLRCQPFCSLQATAAWAPSVASTNPQQFRSGPRPTHRINAHNLNWVSMRQLEREKCGLSLWDLARPTRTHSLSQCGIIHSHAEPTVEDVRTVLRL